MFPSIPENSAKIAVLIGLVLAGYGFLETVESRQEYNNKVYALNASLDSLQIIVLKHQLKGEDLIDISNRLSKRHSIENPISKNDSLIFFRRIESSKEGFVVSDSIEKLWNHYKADIVDFQIAAKKTEQLRDLVKETKEENEKLELALAVICILGSLLIFSGLASMWNIEERSEILHNIELEQKGYKYRYCQSCGEKFSSMIKKGKEANGEINHAFCTNCYHEGEFREPFLTYEEVRKKWVKMASKFSWPRRKYIMRRFKKLERWDQDKFHF